MKGPKKWCCVAWNKKLSHTIHGSRGAHRMSRAGPTSQRETRTRLLNRTIITYYPSVKLAQVLLLFFILSLSFFLSGFLPSFNFTHLFRHKIWRQDREEVKS